MPPGPCETGLFRAALRRAATAREGWCRKGHVMGSGLVRTWLLSRGGALALTGGLLAGPVALALAAQAVGPVDFERDIRPLLAERCWSCHAGTDPKAGLRLDTREGALAGGREGPAVRPGDPATSALMRRVNSRDLRTVMPPGRPLAPVETARLKAWIEAGAPWSARPAPPVESGPHWAFVPPRRPAVPLPQNRLWARNPVDAFVLAKLEAAGLQPSPPAAPEVLLRRVTFDLTGLPPSPEEAATFLADRRPDAYERVVRRLLASPAYGERWAQHWLDVVRFAETNGFEVDGDRPQAWRYRDWVVRALNADLPYDRFLRLQIAGDLAAPEDGDARAAVGFLRAGPQHVVAGNVDPAELRQEWLTEAVTGVGAGVLGLTIQCARCHDHKFDPVSQTEYYGLQAFFAGTVNRDWARGATEEEQARYREAHGAHQAEIGPLKSDIAVIERPYRERLRAEKMAHLPEEYRAVLAVPVNQRTAEQKQLAIAAEVGLKIEWTELVAALSPEDRARRADLRRRLHDLTRRAPAPPPNVPSVEELPAAPPTHVLVRGEVHKRGAAVAPTFPVALGGPAPEPAGPRRPALVDWLVAPEHPLTARVLVNRLWQHHFGRGLVRTPNDFGKNGARPTHPELLDWLAHELRAPGLPSLPGEPWSLKRLHFLLVTSNTYRQASTPDPARTRRDPENDLFWRQNLRRLDAEAVRDSVLAAAGTLNRAAGGPPIRVPLEKEVYDTIFTEDEPDNLWPVTADESQHVRRTLYLLRKRNVRLPLLAVFDQPDMMSPCAARGQSVHALQALTLLNSDFMNDQAAALAARLIREEPRDAARRVDRLYRLALARAPSPREREAAHRFLADQTAIIRRAGGARPLPGLPGNAAEHGAWTDLSLAILNLNDFVYLR